MKKTLSIILSVLFLLSLCACGNNSSAKKETKTTNSTTVDYASKAKGIGISTKIYEMSYKAIIATDQYLNDQQSYEKTVSILNDIHSVLKQMDDGTLAQKENYVPTYLKALCMYVSATDNKTNIIPFRNDLAKEIYIDIIPEETTDTSSEEPDGFTEGYEKAEFDKFNSPAEENGLENTKIYIKCKFDKIVFVNDTSYYALAIDENNNKWVIVLNDTRISSAEEYNKYIGEELICCCTYTGYSEVLKMPAANLDKLYSYNTVESKTGIGSLTE